MRTLLAPVFSTAAALLLLFAAGCFPAFPPDATPTATGTGGSGQPSGAGGSTGSGATDDLGSAPAGDLGSTAVADLGSSGDLGAVACDKVQPTSGLSSPSGHHNAGQECQGCHAPGGGAPTFYLGGTLYSAVTGGAAVAGATINVTDAAGKSVKIVSANNGNFWTTMTLTFPIKVGASLCPSTLPMASAVAGNGTCNNCHNSTFRVHVP
ncbi:MAG: hypothetical protein ACXVCV_18495 [Polyangia bacterium]